MVSFWGQKFYNLGTLTHCGTIGLALLVLWMKLGVHIEPNENKTAMPL